MWGCKSPQGLNHEAGVGSITKVEERQEDVDCQKRLNCDGGIERIKSEFFPAYTAIKDDYKNWR